MVTKMSETSFQKPITPAQISFSKARAAYVGPSLGLAPHRNAVATLVIALHSPFELELLDCSPIGDRRLTAQIALIPAGTLHHLRSSGEMGFIYFDALGDDCARLITTDLTVAHDRLIGQPLEWLRHAHVDAWCELIGVPMVASKDVRIARVVEQIDADPAKFSRVSDAARAAGVSDSRFQALFRQSLGLPFRRYRLWRRMAFVVQTLTNGQTLTEAAYAAGFSSSAHLSASFKAMFGLTPSSLVALRPLVRRTGLF